MAIWKPAPVCSGWSKRDDPRWVPVLFETGDPLALCMGAGLEANFKERCEVRVLEAEVP